MLLSFYMQPSTVGGHGDLRESSSGGPPGFLTLIQALDTALCEFIEIILLLLLLLLQCVISAYVSGPGCMQEVTGTRYQTIYQCSPQHMQGILAPYSFMTDFSLMWERGVA